MNVTANLTIQADNRTTYNEREIENDSTNDALVMIELKCCEEILFRTYDSVDANNIYLKLENDSLVKLNETINKSLGIKSFFVEDYTCNAVPVVPVGLK